MTDSLTVKTTFGQRIVQGFVPDVHCPTGAPRESMVKITRAEPGGESGQGLWRPARMGLRPTYENPTLLAFLAARFVEVI
jgi:nitrate reductase alpha subunit